MNQTSINKRVRNAVGVAVFVGIFTLLFVLFQFYTYTVRTKTVMSGDHKGVVLGQMLEARIKAASGLVKISVSNKKENKKFIKKVKGFVKDIDTLREEHNSKYLRKAKRISADLVTETSRKGKTIEDLFVYHRNAKTTAFNIYRKAWKNKWMTVAKIMGLIINDLDNIPYHSGSRVSSSVFPKIARLTGVITNSTLPRKVKIDLFVRLKNLKRRITSYADAVVASDKLSEQRSKKLAEIGKHIQAFNGTQGNNLTQFGEVEHSKFLIASSAVLSFVLLGLFWFWLSTRRFASHIKRVMKHIVDELSEWVSPSGNVQLERFDAPKISDVEFGRFYDLMDETVQKINTFRKEDLLIKRLLHVPFMLINKNKSAVYWNSSLAHLSKVRVTEELGGVQYRSILRFIDVRGRPVDPIQKCFSEKKEITQLALMKVAQESVAVQVVCTAVIDTNHQVEYVLVHIRDLREENKKSEIELDKQLECVRQGLVNLRNSRLPDEAPDWVRKPVVECIDTIKNYVLEKQDKESVVAGQVQTVWGRIQRESQLKKAIHKRMEQVKGETVEMGDQVALLSSSVEHLVGHLKDFEDKVHTLSKKHDDIKKQGNQLESDLGSSKERLDSCIKWLAKAEVLTKYIRSHERIVRNLVEKSAVQNANNSILGAKIKDFRKELTPNDIVMVTENLNQLTDIFQRSYSFISRSVNEIETGFRDIAGKLNQEIKSCKKIVHDDNKLLKSVKRSEKIVSEGNESIESLLTEINSLKQSARTLSEQFDGMEAKTKHLIQIGEASISLQDQLENGIKGMFDQFSTEPVESSDESPIASA